MSKENFDYLKQETKEFFEINWANETIPLIVWDAFKAFIRGLLIMLNSKEKKQKDKKLKELQEKVREKENEFRKHPKNKRRWMEL